MTVKVVFTVGAVLRGDDAAGPMLAKMMEENPIDGWQVIDGGQTPEDQISVVRRMKPDILLLVDAAQLDAEPGTISTVDEDSVVSDFLITTHSLPITFLLDELKQCCGKVVFLGIQPAHMDFMEPLHPSVLSAVQRIYDGLAGGAAFYGAAGCDALDDATLAGNAPDVAAAQ